MSTPEQVWNQLKNKSFSLPFLIEEQMIVIMVAMQEAGQVLKEKNKGR